MLASKSPILRVGVRPNIPFEADAVTRTRRSAVLSVTSAAQFPR